MVIVSVMDRVGLQDGFWLLYHLVLNHILGEKRLRIRVRFKIRYL